MAIDEAIGKIMDLILTLLPIVKPSDLQKIKNAIAKQEKENEEKRNKFKEALATGDIATLNTYLPFLDD